MKIELCAFADEAAASLDEQIEALSRNGISKLELRSVDGVNIKDITDSRAREIAEALKSRGIQVWSIGSPIGKSDINGDFAVVEKDLKHILELCRIFGALRIRVFSFFTTEYERDEREVVRRMKAMVKFAASYGVRLCHENEKDIFGDKAERVEFLLDSVPDLYSVYDPANYIQVGESRERADRARARADYFHIKDALKSGEIVPAGEGDGDITGMVRSVCRDTVFTVEPHLAVFEGYAAIDKLEMKNKYKFASNGEAFDTAVEAIKKVLISCGYRACGGAFVK